MDKDKLELKIKNIAFKRTNPIIRSMFSMSRGQAFLEFQSALRELAKWIERKSATGSQPDEKAK